MQRPIQIWCKNDIFSKKFLKLLKLSNFVNMHKEDKDTTYITLEDQVQAYDILDSMLAAEEGIGLPQGLRSIAKAFIGRFDGQEPEYDEERLRNELAERLAALDNALKEARFAAAAAASLHEFAKEAFATWQTAGIFARRRVLRELRQRAGFRLESHRIGNYVAKTFDLMNEANARFAKAQQARFAGDVSYKIKPGIYLAISEELRKYPL